MRWRWLWLPVALFLTLVGWAVTSPVGSAPDDDFHLSSIWCSWPADACEPTADDQAILVPRNVVQSADCFRYRDDVTADCTEATSADSSLVIVTHVNQIEHLYPTGFHTAMAMFVGDDVERSVITMRLINAAVISVLLALLMRVAPVGISSATLIALAVTSIPLGLFILASTNPSSWAVGGIVLFWGFASALLRRSSWRSRRTWLLLAGAIATAAMAMTSRVDTGAYLLLAAVLALIAAGPRRWRRISSGVVAVLGILGFISYVTFETPLVGDGAPLGTADAGLGLFLSNAVYLPILWSGIVGTSGLGWNDTAMPTLVPFVGVAALGGLAWLGLSHLWRAKAVAVAVAFGAFALVPLWFLQREGLVVGELVQSRYLAPLLALLMATLLLPRQADRPLPWPIAPAVVVATALAVTSTLAFWINAHRYSFGADAALFDVRDAPVWTGPLSVHPAVFTLLVAVTSSVVIVGALLPPALAHRTPRSRPDRVAA